MKKILLAAILSILALPATAQILPAGNQRVQGTGAPNRGDPVNVVQTDGSGNIVSPPANVAQGSATSGQTGQMSMCATTTSAPTYTTATTNPLSCDTSGNQRVLVNNTGFTATGNVAAAATDAGNPVKIGGYAMSTAPTAVTNGQRTNSWYNLIGAQASFITDAAGAVLTTAVSNVDGKSTGLNRLPVEATNYVFNGTVWDRAKSIPGSDGTGTGVSAVAMAPQSSANGAIAGIPSTVVEGSHVFKASAGNLYRAVITTGGTAGYLMMFNATTAPADGAVTPAMCRVIAANATLSMSFESMPVRFSTGITAVFSSTGCFTKTISATAYIEGYVQ